MIILKLFLGNQSETGSRFRNNQGPHPPTFNQPITGGQAKVVQAEQVLHHII